MRVPSLQLRSIILKIYITFLKIDSIANVVLRAYCPVGQLWPKQFQNIVLMYRIFLESVVTYYSIYIPRHQVYSGLGIDNNLISQMYDRQGIVITLN